MNNALNSLVTAKYGVYKVYCSLSMTANMGVGNEWLCSIEYNGELLRHDDTITAPLNSGITITGTVIKSDSVPDYGSGSVRLTLDGGRKQWKYTSMKIVAGIKVIMPFENCAVRQN